MARDQPIVVTTNMLDDYYTSNHVAGETPQKIQSTTTITSQFFCFLSEAIQTKFKEALTQPKWVSAMNEELSALETNHTWSITYLPAGKRGYGKNDKGKIIVATRERDVDQGGGTSDSNLYDECFPDSGWAY